MAVNVEGIRKAIREDRFEWRMHTLIRLAERGISQRDAINAMLNGDCIREYPEDRPFPSALFLGRQSSGKPLHVVASYYERECFCYIITVYEPDSEHFEDDWKTRKR